MTKNKSHLLKSIYLKFGINNSERLRIEPNEITIIVGPNGSGKSLLLKELYRLCDASNAPKKSMCSLLDNISVKYSTPEHFSALIDSSLSLSQNQNAYRMIDIVGNSIGNFNFTKQMVDGWVGKYHPMPNQDIDFQDLQNHDSLRVLLSLQTAYIDGNIRLQLAQTKKKGKPNQNPINYLDKLFRNPPAKQRLNKYIQRSINKFLVLDVANDPGNIILRLSDSEPDTSLEYGSDGRSISFHNAASLVSDCGDGIKAYIGILSAVASENYGLYIIDEPEAYLHPPLSRKLGNDLARIIVEGDSQLVVVTHSAEFILGCIETGTPVNIVRLTYSNGLSQASLLDSQTVSNLFKDPFIRPAEVTSGMFHKGVVVCEAVADRAFYEIINERLRNEQMPHCPDTLFLNSNGKDTTRRIAGALRKINIPVAVIMDLDAFLGYPSAVSLTMKSFGIPDTEIATIKTLSDNITKAWDLTNPNKKIKESTVDEISRIEPSINNLIKLLDNSGIFLCNNGELEGWLGYLNLKRNNKNDWFQDVLSKFSQPKSSPDYISPKSDDVWDFINKIGSWIESA